MTDDPTHEWFEALIWYAALFLVAGVLAGCVTRTTVCVGVSHGLQPATYDRAERDRADTSVCAEFER